MSKEKRVPAPLPKPADDLQRSPADEFESEMQQIHKEHVARESFELGAQLGSFITAGFIGKQCAAAQLRFFEEARKSKAYKHFPVPMPDGEVRPAHDLKEFCEAVFGKSYRSLAEESATLEALGETLFDATKLLKISRAEVRLLVSMPEDEREAVTTALENSDKAEVKSILHDLVEKLEAARKAEADARADLEAEKGVSRKNHERADEAQRELEKLKGDPITLKHKTDWSAGFKKLIEDVDGLDKTIKESLGSLEIIRLGVTQMEVPNDEEETFLHVRKHLASRMREIIIRAKENIDALEYTWNNTLGAMTDEDILPPGYGED